MPSAQANKSYFLHPLWILKKWGFGSFKSISQFLPLTSRTEWASHQLTGTSHGVPLLLGSSLIIPLKLAKMAGSPDAGACWRGGWPVVSTDRPWRVLGVIGGLEKYSFNIFWPGNMIFFLFYPWKYLVDTIWSRTEKNTDLPTFLESNDHNISFTSLSILNDFFRLVLDKKKMPLLGTRLLCGSSSPKTVCVKQCKRSQSFQ